MQPNWRQIQRHNFTNWRKLFCFLELDSAYAAFVIENKKFPLNLPKRLAEKILKNTWNDPILKQFLPTQNEQQSQVGFCSDPIDESAFKKTSKLLHKYEGRALLICTSACAMHCRYCFRRSFEYDSQTTLFEKEIALIEQDPTLSEILLSGGDPLSLSNEVLDDLLQRLSSIPHVKRLRFHTRFPIGIPERIDEGFLALLERIPLQVVFVIHCNHVAELDDAILDALKKIQKLGIPVLNQSVLLKGVNDTLDSLKMLCERLADHGVIPYYLHQLDEVEGAAHFEVDREIGMMLVEQLAEQLPGYAVPKYVKEIAGERSKTLLAHIDKSHDN